MARPKKIKPLVKVAGAVERAKDLGCNVFDIDIGPRSPVTDEYWAWLIASWLRVKGEFLPTPDRLGGPSHSDPYRCKPGTRPWMWWSEHGLNKYDHCDDDETELRELQRLGALIPGELEAAQERIRKYKDFLDTIVRNAGQTRTMRWTSQPEVVPDDGR